VLELPKPSRLSPRIKVNEVVDLTIEMEDGTLYKMPVFFHQVHLETESIPDYGPDMLARYYTRGMTSLTLEGNVSGEMKRIAPVNRVQR
jgi:hypothetical protein